MKTVFYNSFSYYLIRVLLSPFGWLPYRVIHFIGARIGTLAYWLSPKRIKKITYNNLSLAKDLNLSEKQMKKIAKEAFQNLIINGLEYFRLKRSRNKIDRFVKPHNLGPLEDLSAKEIGSVCVTGHISNWELCFLSHTQRHSAKAIGKHIKNPKLYEYILSIREMHKGKIVEMKNAVSQGIKDLKCGASFTMVNDQAYTSSSYSYPFFGANAWTSTAPALMAYKANVPIFAVTTKRLKKGKYEFSLSKPIWPDTSKPLKGEVIRLMDEIMATFEHHIKENPGQWLWQHQRWKQEGYNYIIHEYKADSLLVVLPDDEKLFQWMCDDIWVIPQIYTRSFLTFMIPEKFKDRWPLKNFEVITYKNFQDILIRDYRFQLIYDFCNNPKIGKHFLKLGAHKVYSLEKIINRFSHKHKKDYRFFEMLSKVICLKEARFVEPNSTVV